MSEIRIYITRTDGAIARLDLEDDGRDLWDLIGDGYPEACDYLDTSMLLPPDGGDYDWDASFVPGDGEALASWLCRVTARVVDVDVQGRRKVVHEVEGGRGFAVGRAIDWATAFVESSGVDAAEMDVRVMVGGEEVWSWLEASQ